MKSTNFVDRIIEKVDKMRDDCFQNIKVTPECLKNEYESARLNGYSSIPPYQRKEIKEYYDQLRSLSYVNGFWMGYGIGMKVAKESKNEKI